MISNPIFVFLFLELKASEENQALCAKTYSDTGKWNMTKYLAMMSWFLLLLWEFMQLISKILSRRLSEYFSWQNITEVTMISLTAAFFIKQWMESCPLHDGKTF